MNFILISVGSDGDVFPAVSLGRSLALRGNRVTLLASPTYAQLAARNGIGFIPLATPDSCAAGLRQKWLLATRYAGLYYDRYCVSWNSTASQAISARCREDQLVIAFDRRNLWADLYARARLGVPGVRVLVDLPFAFRSGPSLFFPDSQIQRRLGGRVELAWRKAMKSAAIDNGHLRIERLWHSVRPAVPTIALWPRWMLGQRAITCRIPAFGFLPPPAVPDLAVDLPDCTDGRRVVVFVAGTMGTTQWWANRFFEISAEVCRRLGCVGVFLGGDEAAESASRGRGLILRSGFLPLRRLLPHASAIVHHGGIGTAAAAIECGVSQVVIPRVFMQASNAEWLRRLGLAVVLKPKAYTPAGGSSALQEALGNPIYRDTAKALSPRCDMEASLRTVCEYLENPSFMIQLRLAALPPHRRPFAAQAAVAGDD